MKKKIVAGAVGLALFAALIVALPSVPVAQTSIVLLDRITNLEKAVFGGPNVAGTGLSASAYTPMTSAGRDLGSASLPWGNLYLLGNLSGDTEPSIAAAATLSLTAAQSGSLVLMGATAGEVITLPTPAAGLQYDVVITVSNTSNSNEIQTGASQFLLGSVVEAASAGAASSFWADGTSTRAYKCNGTTTGGLIGSRLHIVGISATQWEITGTNLASGVIATPFTGTP